MKRLNKFLSPDDLKQAKEMYKEAVSLPMLSFDGRRSIGQSLMESMYQFVHHKALEQGLPDRQGWYGFDSQTGEFVDFDSEEKK